MTIFRIIWCTAGTVMKQPVHSNTLSSKERKVCDEVYESNFIDLNLNSVNQLIFVMVKCGVLFEVLTGFLNII